MIPRLTPAQMDTLAENLARRLDFRAVNALPPRIVRLQLGEVCYVTTQLSARSGNTLGSGQVQLVNIDASGAITNRGDPRDCWNFVAEVVAVNTIGTVKQTVQGHLIFDAEDCSASATITPPS